MNDNLTEIVVILDQSGSMECLAKDTIGGYNGFIEQQKKLPGEANLTTVLFDSDYALLHDRINLKDVKPITNKEYVPSSMTALLDAVGKTIDSIGNKLSNTPEPERPSKVLFLIITDGEENASKEYSYDRIKEMVKTQQDIYKWQFIFFGANIDSFDAASSLGIDINHAVDYSATNDGIDSLYSTVSSVTGNYRSTGKIDNDFASAVK
jgi:uncharacterized protein YegL